MIRLTTLLGAAALTLLPTHHALAGSISSSIRAERLATTYLNSGRSLKTPNEFFETYPECTVYAVDFAHSGYVSYMIVHAAEPSCGVEEDTE